MKIQMPSERFGRAVSFLGRPAGGLMLATKGFWQGHIHNVPWVWRGAWKGFADGFTLRLAAFLVLELHCARQIQRTVCIEILRLMYTFLYIQEYLYIETFSFFLYISSLSGDDLANVVAWHLPSGVCCSLFGVRHSAIIATK